MLPSHNHASLSKVRGFKQSDTVSEECAIFSKTTFSNINLLSKAVLMVALKVKIRKAFRCNISSV